MRIVTLCLAVTVVSSILVALPFAGCHGRIVEIARLTDLEFSRGTRSEHLTWDYRSATWPLRESLRPALHPTRRGSVARGAEGVLSSHYRRVAGPLRVVVPVAAHFSWFFPALLSLVLLSGLGVLGAVAFARLCAGRLGRRRHWAAASADVRERIGVAPALAAATAYVVASPLAGVVAWLTTASIWWPEIIQPAEGFPGFAGGAAAAAVCLAISLPAGWLAAWAVVTRRIERRPCGPRRWCAACGYDRGREADDACPECGATPGQRHRWRRLAKLLASAPIRVGAYIIIIGGITIWMWCWAFGAPSVTRSADSWFRSAASWRPQLWIPLHAMRSVGVPTRWRNDPEPTVVRWPGGVAIVSDHLIESAPPAAGPVQLAYAWGWCPLGLDEHDITNWQFGSDLKEFALGRRQASLSLQFDGGHTLYRLYMMDERQLSVASLSPIPTAIEQSAADHPLSRACARVSALAEDQRARLPAPPPP